MYGLVQTSAPAFEPVSIDGPDGLRSWCRQDSTVDDDLIITLGRVARGMIEKLAGRQLVTATWRMTLDWFPGYGGWQGLLDGGLYVMPDQWTIRLPRAPLQSVTSVTYYDLANVQQTLASTVYDVDAATDPGRLSLAQYQIWPITRVRPGAVQVTFQAGYGTASAVPDEYKQAIRFAVGQWYEHRGDDAAMGDLPAACKMLIQTMWNGELEYGV